MSPQLLHLMANIVLDSRTGLMYITNMEDVMTQRINPVTRINPGFARTYAGKGLRRIMREYDAKSWAPYGAGGAIIYDRNGREISKISAGQIRSWAR
jgi:hypothetical protein